jgi:hypothetical protein
MADLPTKSDFDDFSAWTGRDVVAPDGERLGAVEVIFLDEATDVPEWVLVRLEEDSAAFVPLAGATVEERAIRVGQDRERIGAAPRIDVDKTLTIAEVRLLYDHYGLAYSQAESPTVLPETDGPAPAEQRPRLRKYIGSPVPPLSQHAPEVQPPPPAEGRGGPLALLTKKRALPVVLAAGIAGLIGVLALRRRR